MNIKKEIQEKIQVLQSLEQNLQALMLQKQAFQVELNEAESALSEIGKTKDDIYRITGQIMLKTDKNQVEKELTERKDIISLRLKSIDKQEKLLKEKLEKLKEEVTNEIKKE
ncbi:prefoldin subunit beta [Candidatus Pacearchaeota archaeon]|nr:prefoldin subunit beta [Candidatus Pacearchaeota archaeon]